MLFLKLFQLFHVLRSDQPDTERQVRDETYTQKPHRLTTSRRLRRRRPSGIELRGNDIKFFPENVEDVESSHLYRILPIFSGIMIPFSIMLLIPSLTGNWYIRTGNNHVVLEVRPNPQLLKISMGFSMGCAIIASSCLVARFAERNIKLMTQLCLCFLSLHDLINILAVTIFGFLHRFDDGFTYGQPFWLTVCSTVASTATNITLIYDYKQTVNFSHSGSGLTLKQRSLVIIIIILLAYMSLGSGVLSVMLGITFIDALYLSVVSIEAIGFGDIHPTTPGPRVFLCLYVVGGIINLSLAVALSRETILEAAAVGFHKRMKAARAREREQHILIRWRAAVQWRLRSKGLPVWIADHTGRSEERIAPGRMNHWYSSLRRFWRRLWNEVWREWEDPAWKYICGPNQTRLNLEALSHSQLETAALETGAPLSELVPKGLILRNREQENVNSPASQFPSADSNSHPPSLTHVRFAGMVSVLARFAIALTHEAFNGEKTSEDSDETIEVEKPTPNDIPLTRSLTTTMTIQEGNVDPAKAHEIEERHAFYFRLTVAWSLFVVFWMGGSAIFMKTEKWGFGSAAYFCFITFSTVGYGDLTPETPAGRSIFVVWALLGVGTMTTLISILAEACAYQYKSLIRSDIPQENTHKFEGGNQRSSGVTALGTNFGLFSSSSLKLNMASTTTKPCVSDGLSAQGYVEPPKYAVRGAREEPAGSSFHLLERRERDPRPSRPLGRSLTMTSPVAESCISDGQLAQENLKAHLDKLSFQIILHARTLRSIMDLGWLGNIDVASENVDADPSNQGALRSKIEKSLVEVTQAVNDVLSVSQIRP